MPKISIALCTYFGERYLKQQLDSLSEQTHHPYEIVICDDGSTDGTRQIIEDWQLRSPLDVQIHFNETQLGYAANFEKAFQICRGDWVAFCDQDDIWLPQKLANIHKVCHSQLGIIFHDAWLILNGSRTTLWNHCGLSQKWQKGKTGLQKILKKNVAYGNTMVVRKNAIPKQAFPFYRDHDGWLAHLIALEHPVHFLNEPLIHYRQHEDQIIPNRMAKPSLVHQLTGMKQSYQVMKDEIDFIEHLMSRMGSHPLLKQKKKHLQQRVAISLGNGSLRKAFSDFRQGHYHHYSNGFVGFIKDMATQIF